MVVDDLEKVMLTVLEHHEDTFIFEDDLGEVDDVWMAQLGA